MPFRRHLPGSFDSSSKGGSVGVLEWWPARIRRGASVAGGSIGKLPLLLACIFLAGCPGPKVNPPPSVSPTPTPSPIATPVQTPTPTPTPLPEAIIPYSHKEGARLFNGDEVQSHVESGIGDSVS